MTTQTSLASSIEPKTDRQPDLSDAPGPSHTTPRRWIGVAILIALWAAIFFASLFAPPLLDDADATHSNAARHILTSGDWVTLYVNGIRYLEKAPLPYWLVAASFRVFGFNTFAAHLPQAIAVLLLALLGYTWGAKTFNLRTGLYTGVAVLTSAGVFLFTRIFIPEVWLALFLAAALYTFLQSLSSLGPAPPPNTVILTMSNAKGKNPDDAHSPAPLGPFNHKIPGAPHLASEMWDRSAANPGAPSIAPPQGDSSSAMSGPSLEGADRIYPYLTWTALALAVLTKGLVALVFFFGTAILYLALTGDYRRWRRLKPLTGAILFLAIAAPWHILAGLRNTAGFLQGRTHGFLWFYFVNEHFLRFLGKRYPVDYNKLPGYLFWSLHLVWLFPWALFTPLWIAQQNEKWVSFLATHKPRPKFPWSIEYAPILGGAILAGFLGLGTALKIAFIWAVVRCFYEFHRRRLAFNEPGLPLTALSVSQRTALLLTLYSALVLLFFSFSTNQEYYTFPAYLPLLMLIAASLARAEAAYPTDVSSRRWILAAQAALTVIGIAAATALFLGLWTSRHLPFVPDIGELLAHRGVGDYTLSMSHFFDLTGPSFAALRLPAILAAVAFAFGPTLAWFLRTQRRHLAATGATALTSATFLIAAHIALVRFGPMLSSQDIAARITTLRNTRAVAPSTEVMLYGDQSYGSSIAFYLGQQVSLVEGRSSSMIFGSTFPDAPRIFLTNEDLLEHWGTGPRKLLFVPLERRDDLDRILPTARQLVLAETSGKALITDRPLDTK